MRNTKTSRILASLARGGLLLLVGCAGDDTADTVSFSPALDLAVTLPRDGGTVDLAQIPPPIGDLAWSACAGTKLAGTCVERFFEPFVACFQPAGNCGGGFSNSATEWCWQDGARVVQTHFVTPVVTSYRVRSNACLTRYSYRNPVPSEQYCRPADLDCGPQTDGGYFDSPPGPGGAHYDTGSGIFTCPDGTQVDVGANLGACSVLNELLNPSAICNNGPFATCL